MRSISHAPAVLLVLILMLSGCGQKGPLYIPEEMPEETQKEKQAETAEKKQARLQPLPSTPSSEN